LRSSIRRPRIKESSVRGHWRRRVRDASSGHAAIRARRVVKQLRVLSSTGLRDVGDDCPFKPRAGPFGREGAAAGDLSGTGLGSACVIHAIDPKLLAGLGGGTGQRDDENIKRIALGQVEAEFGTLGEKL
jgi:hypothetical protein